MLFGANIAFKNLVKPILLDLAVTLQLRNFNFEILNRPGGETVDTLASGVSAVMCEGSNPSLGTKVNFTNKAAE